MISGALSGPTAVVLGTVIASNLIRIFSSVILTRLLSSSAFGIVNFVVAIAFILSMLSDIGVMPFVVRHQAGMNSKFLDEVWTIRLCRSILLAAINAALSWPIAAYTQKPELQPVLLIWSLYFILDGLGSMSFTIAIRQGLLRRLSFSDLACAIFQVIMAVVFTLILRTYWGMVCAIMAAATLKAVLSYVLFPGSRRHISFNIDTTKELFHFSRFIGASSIMTIAISQSDKLYFGRILPLAILGFYTLAGNLSSAPLAAATPFAERLLYPSYARLVREGVDMRAAYYAVKRRFVLFYMFVTGGLIGVAPLIVRILYDPRYLSVGWMMQVLACAPLLYLNNIAADQVLIATGRQWNTMAVGVIRILWLVVAAIIIYFTGHPIIFMFFIGTIEVPATLFHWALLKVYGLLDFKEEAIPLLSGMIGIGLGWLVDMAAHVLFG